MSPIPLYYNFDGYGSCNVLHWYALGSLVRSHAARHICFSRSITVLQPSSRYSICPHVYRTGGVWWIPGYAAAADDVCLSYLTDDPVTICLGDKDKAEQSGSCLFKRQKRPFRRVMGAFDDGHEKPEGGGHRGHRRWLPSLMKHARDPSGRAKRNGGSKTPRLLLEGNLPHCVASELSAGRGALGRLASGWEPGSRVLLNRDS